MRTVQKNSVFGSQKVGYGAPERAVCIRNIADYSPFGVQLDGRTMQADFYRHGFNGMEKDDELKGLGNSYDFGARMYDSRVGRWLTIDAMASKYPAISPFVFSLNSPLLFKDPNGEDAIVTVQKNENGGGTITISTVVYITGKGASPEIASELTTLASKVFKEGVYKAEDGDYKVVFDVKYEFSKEKPVCRNETENELNFAFENARSSVPDVHLPISDGSGEVFYTANEGIINKEVDGFWRFSALHETLHLLGLSDRYDKKDVKGPPDEGFGRDIMGRNGASNISQCHYDNYGKMFAGKKSGTYILDRYVDLDKTGKKIGVNDEDFYLRDDQRDKQEAIEVYGEPNK